MITSYHKIKYNLVLMLMMVAWSLKRASSIVKYYGKVFFLLFYIISATVFKFLFFFCILTQIFK